MFTALTVFFLTIVLGTRVLFYVPMRHAMGNASYDRVSFAVLNMMYWGVVLLAGAGYIVAVAALYRGM